MRFLQVSNLSYFPDFAFYLLWFAIGHRVRKPDRNAARIAARRIRGSRFALFKRPFVA